MQSINTFNRSTEKGRIDPVPLSSSDLLLCAGGVIALSTSLLNNPDNPSPLLSIISKVAAVGMIIGELYIVKEQVQIDASKSLEKLRNDPNTSDSPFAAMQIPQLEQAAQNGMKNAIWMVGGKWVTLILLKSMYQPQNQGWALLTAMLTAAHTVPRAFRELQKTFHLENPKEHRWEIVRNTFVHGFNASYSLYNIGELFYGLFYPSLPPVFPPADSHEKSPPGPVKTYSEITIPSEVNDTSICELATTIAELENAPHLERDRLISQFVNRYPWTSTQQKSRQIHLLFHPDKRTCINGAKAYELLKNTLQVPVLELPNPKNHYNHHREVHRIAELREPPFSSESNQISFACHVFDGLCSSLQETLSTTNKNLQTIVEHTKLKYITVKEAQESILSHFIYHTNMIHGLLKNRDDDVAEHIVHQIHQKQQSFLDYMRTNPQMINLAINRFVTASVLLSNTYGWKKAIEGVDCKAVKLDCDTEILKQRIVKSSEQDEEGIVLEQDEDTNSDE